MLCRTKYNVKLSNFRSCITARFMTSTHVDAIKMILGDDNVITKDNDAFEKYTVDWTSVFRGGGLVCLPRHTEHISQLMRYCHNNRIAVVPQGGNTGLCGGATGRNSSEIIISLEKMNHILSIEDHAIICEAGCTLQALDDAAKAKGRLLPLDLAAKGSCMIGGNISTNAGGLRVLRYGSIGKNVLGLEVVLADGTVLDMITTLLKDNNGYNLNNLFVGSEGTLGIVTKAAIRLVPRPSHISVMVAKLSRFDKLPDLLRLTHDHLHDVLSAFEYVDTASYDILSKHAHHLIAQLPDSIKPSSSSSPSSSPSSSDDDDVISGIHGPVLVLIECSACGDDDMTDRLERFLETAVEKDIIIDAIMSKSVQEEQSLWMIREQVSSTLMQASRMISHDGRGARGKLFKYDISINLHHVNAFIDDVRHQLIQAGYHFHHHHHHHHHHKHHDEHHMMILDEYEFMICTFGHAGDENIHLNILLTPRDSIIEFKGHHLSDDIIDDVYKVLDDIVYSQVILRKGSISAEHGIGQLKQAYMMKSRQPQQLALMHALKSMMDKHHILNPGKVLPI